MGAQGFCELEKLARSRGQHPWTFKPADPLDDPHRQDPQGKPWQSALAGELAYLAQAQQLPILGSPGHSVEELLGPHTGVMK